MFLKIIFTSNYVPRFYKFWTTHNDEKILSRDFFRFLTGVNYSAGMFKVRNKGIQTLPPEVLCRKKDALENFVIKLIAETLARMFSCEFCEIFENTRTFLEIFNTRVTNTHVKNVKKRVRSCPMRIFLFLKFYSFIKRIVSIYTVFFKKLKVH